MAIEQTIRFFEFTQNDLKDEFELVGYRKNDRKEIRTSFNDLLFSLGLIDYSEEDIQAWLDEGYSWLDIGVFLLQKENLKRSISEPFIFARIPSKEIDTLIEYLKTPEGFSNTGIAFCDGTPFVDNSGSSWSLQNRFIRSYGPNLQENGEKLACYQTQEDAMQKLTGNLGSIVRASSKWGGDGTVSGVFSLTQNWNDPKIGASGSQWNNGVNISFESSRVARTANETRPKNIYFPYFQVVKKLDFRSLPKSPVFLSE